MASGVAYLKCDSMGNVIGWGYVTVAMIPDQVTAAGEVIVPVTGAQMIAVSLASANGETLPYKIDLEQNTTVTVVDKVGNEDVSTDYTFAGLVVANP